MAYEALGFGRAQPGLGAHNSKDVPSYGLYSSRSHGEREISQLLILLGKLQIPEATSQITEHVRMSAAVMAKGWALLERAALNPAVGSSCQAPDQLAAKLRRTVCV